MNQQQNLKAPSAKLCIVEGHQNQISTNICMFKSCEFNNRWICIKCVLQKKHSHNLESDYHIVDQEMFYKLLKDKQQKTLKQIRDMSNCTMGFIKQLKFLVEEVNIILQQLENELEAQNKSNTLILIEQMIQITEEDFSQISNEQILRFNESNIQLNIDFYQEFKQNMNRINQNIQNIIKDIDHYCSGEQLEKKNIDEGFIQEENIFPNINNKAERSIQNQYEDTQSEQNKNSYGDQQNQKDNTNQEFFSIRNDAPNIIIQSAPQVTKEQHNDEGEREDYDGNDYVDQSQQKNTQKVYTLLQQDDENEPLLKLTNNKNDEQQQQKKQDHISYRKWLFGYIFKKV